MLNVNPFIHLSSASYPGLDSMRSSLSRDNQTSLPSATSSFSQIPWRWETRCSKPTERCNLSRVSWSRPEASSWWHMPHLEAPRNHLNCDGVALLLLSRSSPATLPSSKLISATSCICDLMDRGESECRLDSVGFMPSSALTTTYRYSIWITTDAAPMSVSISHFNLPSLVNKTLRYYFTTWTPPFSKWETWPLTLRW